MSAVQWNNKNLISYFFHICVYDGSRSWEFFAHILLLFLQKNGRAKKLEIKITCTFFETYISNIHYIGWYKKMHLHYGEATQALFQLPITMILRCFQFLPYGIIWTSWSEYKNIMFLLIEYNIGLGMKTWVWNHFQLDFNTKKFNCKTHFLHCCAMVNS